MAHFRLYDEACIHLHFSFVKMRKNVFISSSRLPSFGVSEPNVENGNSVISASDFLSQQVIKKSSSNPLTLDTRNECLFYREDFKERGHFILT